MVGKSHTGSDDNREEGKLPHQSVPVLAGGHLMKVSLPSVSSTLVQISNVGADQ